ncbi:protein adenylyltransferase SelO [Orrella sp. 11846]|uniref:protein adenylyltransferase SelO n=1 Tax=Orrella sp. 11846 TaxID=3409913 RepID=UPI003B5C3E1A
MSQSLNWNFDHSYAGLPALFFVEQAPKKVKHPQLIEWNHTLADALGLNTEGLTADDLAMVFSGQLLPEYAKPISQAYAGHQFGHFTMLGDGRAILLGEHLTPSGERVDIQFKGSGPTPFSRRGDGLAGLGPMLREYLISEAMHALGIATTRSLAVVRTGDRVWREDVQDGAILTRVASSHLRVGTFQYAAAHEEPEAVKVLIDYALERHFPDEIRADEPSAVSLFRAVMTRQAALIVDWMRVGFIHGVMNTDNMTISGETIDYGPCAFMDHYDPNMYFSSVDRQGRYAFANQPPIAQWNLTRFIEALLSEICEDPSDAVEPAKVLLREFEQMFQTGWLQMMGNKLGLLQPKEEDRPLIDDLLALMRTHRLDYTNTFIALMQTVQPDQIPEAVQAQEITQALSTWMPRWQARLAEQSVSDAEVFAEMLYNNPLYIPRNHLVEQVLEAATRHQDFEPFDELMDVLSQPYTFQPGRASFMQAASLEAQTMHRTFCGT